MCCSVQHFICSQNSHCQYWITSWKITRWNTTLEMSWVLYVTCVMLAWQYTHTHTHAHTHYTHTHTHTHYIYTHTLPGPPREFMGPRANYKWDLKACPKKILRIRPSEIKFEGNFSSRSQHLRSSEYNAFLIAEILRIKISKRMWGWFQQFINGYIPFWSLGIRPSEIEFQSDFSKLVFYSYVPFWLPSEIELGSHFRSIITVFVIYIQELADCKKFLRIRPLRLNVRAISAVYPSIIIYWIPCWLLY